MIGYYYSNAEASVTFIQTLKNVKDLLKGKSGIFELDNGLPITDFRIANPGGSNPKYIDAFLLDYAYATQAP